MKQQSCIQCFAGQKEILSILQGKMSSRFRLEADALHCKKLTDMFTKANSYNTANLVVKVIISLFRF